VIVWISLLIRKALLLMAIVFAPIALAGSSWDQTRSQGLVVEVAHPVLGTVELPGPPVRFDDLPYAGGRAEHLPPPGLGEHNASVAAWLDAREVQA